MIDRRQFLGGLAALLAQPAWAALPTSREAASSMGEGLQLAASWHTALGYQVGVLDLSSEGGLRIAAALDVPTRAHDLVREPAGTLLAVARRPGDWLVRFDRQGRALAWRWIEPGRAFAGHVLVSPDGRSLYTTELDLERETGLVAVRDARTLEKRSEWPTHGLDPHQLTWDAHQPDTLIVANGGVPTRPETGRLKRNLEGMDSSLVRLDAATGELLAQWRLDDPRLSLRHLAWNGQRLGIALQAEHDDPEVKTAAPILAVLEDEQLRSVPGPILEGYGGAIAALGEGFAVSCPRSQGLAVFAAGGFRERVDLAEVCPLSSSQGYLWAGGRHLAMGLTADAQIRSSAVVVDLQLDNHWVAI